jgi:general stress protein YciG
MNPVLDPTSNTSPESTEETNTTETSAPAPKPRKPRGFAAMDRKKVSEIASKGGKAAHAAGTAHQFTSDEARVAGKKGGVAPHVRRGRGPRIAPAEQQSAGERSERNEEEAKSGLNG